MGRKTITVRQERQALELAMANYISLFSAILIIIGSINGARSLAAAAAPMRSSRGGQLAALQQQQRQQLQIAFYDDSCPNLHSLVLESMRQAATQDLRAPASILRLFFHDCFVQGCDGSILLDDAPGIRSEKNAGPNANSARGFDVIDAIKADVEAECPGVVSCADILALAARDAVFLSGGPSWDVPLGRLDSTTAGFDEANEELPSPSSDLDTLITKFRAHGLSFQDLITLSGAHTIGLGKCEFFRDRIYGSGNESEGVWPMNAWYARRLQRQCPAKEGEGDDNLAALDSFTPFSFDNRYFVGLLRGRGLFTSDQALLSGSSSPDLALRLIISYAQNPRLFAANFGASMINLGNLGGPLAGRGEVRQNCRLVNGNRFRRIGRKRNSIPPR